MFSAPGTWSLKVCRNQACKLVWLDPFPIERDIPLAYQQYYTHDQSVEGSNRLAGVRTLLYAVYRKLSLIPGALIGLGKARRRLSFMFLDEAPRGRLLDVGCGDGAFLQRMQQSGWDVQGLDFDAKAVQNAKTQYGLDVFCGGIKQIPFKEASFDAITLSHVIEHVPNPLEMFADCKRLLRNKGLLVITTPNTASLGHSVFGKYWRGLEPPRHLHLFSPANLKECARRTGLAIVKSASTGVNADVIAGASYSIQSSADHRTQIAPPPNISRTLKSVLFQYREQLLLRGNADLGEEAVLICTKNTA
jgi:2-polyprenyl-3-methyl-5-hydroxy-6-metoxy-1,4-benzoquinol methylase